jgi:hypothetical protein
MYRVELQFDDISGNTQIDPSKIPHYPINDALASVAGRNLVGLPWDALVAKQAQGSQAMLRDQALRSISIAHGVPEVHLGGCLPRLSRHAYTLLATTTTVRPSTCPLDTGRCA